MEQFLRGSSLLVVSACFLCTVFLVSSEQFTAGLNLALGKPTWQYPPGISPSERAVDGDTNMDFQHGSCTHTTDKQSEEPASWSVDLRDEFYITGVKIYNRKEFGYRLRRFRLYGYPGNVTLYDDATLSSPQYKNDVIYVPLDSGQLYRNITVYLPTVSEEYAILTLCEVQIFGGCRVPYLNNGFFSDTKVQQLNRTKKVVPSGTQIKAICSAGHNFSNEDNALTCGYNYTWDISDPMCTAITCILLTLDNGTYTYNQTDPNNLNAFGTVVTAECNKGFELQGNRQRKCQANESWSGDTPHCTFMGVHPDLFGAKDDHIQIGFIISISVNVVFFLALLGAIFVFKRKYNKMAQQSAVYMDLTARFGAASQETVYTDISGKQQEDNTHETQKVYDNTETVD